MKPILFNHGIYEEVLNTKLDHLHTKLKESSDPYEQWNIKEQIKLVEELRLDYKKSVEKQLKQ